MRSFLTISLMLTFIYSEIKAQDVSLSQYHNLSCLLNPASTGSYGDDIKATLSHKRQWNSVSTPFITNLFCVEWNPGSKNKNKINKPSFGLVAVTDMAGSSGYKSSIFRALGAYHLRLNKTKNLSFGLELGYNQRNFSFDGLAWDAQFNGVGYDASLPTLENFNNTSNKNLDAGFGMEFTNKKPRKLHWKSGVALHHYYQKQTVLENGEDALPTLAQLYFQGQQTNGFMVFRYYALVQSQSLAALSGTLGMDASYRFNYDSKYTNFSTSSAITAGVFYRYRDAVIALLGYEYKRQFRLSVSYDVNISTLRTSSKLNGGPEINLAYFGNFDRKRSRLRKIK